LRGCRWLRHGHAQQRGLAVAYLVARLAGEYRGQVVTGYEVLERAGLIAPAVGLDGASRNDAGAGSGAGGATGWPEDRLQLCRLLVALLDETAGDFERLPFFVRPLARAGFKGKAGRSLQAWQQAAKALQRSIEAGEAIDAAQVSQELDRLIGYVRGVPAETTRFARDAAVLREVQERMNGYESDLLALRAALMDR